MAVQIANLTAQIGADLTQFKLGMNEVDARLTQAGSKAQTAANKVAALAQLAQNAQDDAARFAAEAVTAAATGATTRASTLRRMASRAADRAGRLGVQGIDVDRQSTADMDVAEAYAARLRENAREHNVRAFNAIGAAATRAGEAITAAFAGATKVGSDYNAMMMKAVHNTSLSAEGAAVMNESVARLGEESGANLDQLAEGFRRVENFSFGAADATKITEIAMHSAVGAGADLSNTAELLAKSMVQFSIPVERANDAMNVMHVAANLSSLELNQLVHVGGQAYSMAANLGISFVDVNAAIVTFTKAGLNASEAMQQFRNDLSKLIHPSQAVIKHFDDIKHKSGVDLSKTFNYTALQSKGLAGAFGDIRRAADKMGVSVESLANALFPNLRGTIGAMIMSSDKGFNTFNDTVNKLNDAWSGKLDPTTKQYQETLKLTDTQINRAKNALILMSAEINNSLAPNVIQLTGLVRGIAHGFSAMDKATHGATSAFGLFTGIALITFGAVTKLVVGIASLDAALVTLTGIGIVETWLTKIVPLFTAAGSAAAAFAVANAPLIAAGVLLALVFTGVALRIRQVDEAAANADKGMRELAKTNAKAASDQFMAQGRIKTLVDRYTELGHKAKATAKDHEEMHGILDKLSVLSPDLVTGYTEQGHAIALIAKAAKDATDKLEAMRKEAGRAAAANAFVQFEPQLQQRDALNAQIEAIKEAQRQGRAFSQPPGFNPAMPRTMDPGAPGAWRLIDQYDLATGATNPKFAAAASADMAQLRSLQSQVAEIDRAEAQMHHNMRDNLHNFGKAATDATKKHKQGYEDHSTKVKQAIDVWRDKIVELEGALFKLGKTEETATVDWMKRKPFMEDRVLGLTSVSKAYHVAAALAGIYATAVKNADNATSFDKAMDAFKTKRQPRSSRLEDIAAFEVGDPTKDVWRTQRFFDKFAPGGPRMRTIDTPSKLTGEDPVKSRWNQVQKATYLAAAATKQYQKDVEEATKQGEKLWTEMLRPLEKQKSVFAQTVDEITDLPELFDQLGIEGTAAWASIAQWAYDAAEAEKSAEKAFKEYLETWDKGLDALDKAHGRIEALGLAADGFGEDMTTAFYAATAAVEVFGTPFTELSDEFAQLAWDIGAVNHEFAHQDAVRKYNSDIRELSANVDAANMNMGDFLEVSSQFDKWLMRTTGHRQADFASMEKGQFHGLSLDQYHKMFDLQMTSDQATRMEEAVKNLRQTRVEMGLVRFASYDAQLAWEMFGTSFNQLTKEMQQRVHAFGVEMKSLQQISKMRRLWETEAQVLEDSFTAGFDAVLSKQKSFWQAFTETFKQEVAHILASEAAKEMVRFMGKITGMDKAGKTTETGNGKGLDGKDIAGAAIGVLLSGSGLPNMPVTPFMPGGGGGLPGLPGGVNGATPVFIVGMSPQVMMGGGIPGMPGGGGMGGGSFAAVGSLFGPIGTGIGAALDIAHGFGLFARGGRPAPGRAAIVGENGPELWVPDTSGTVYNRQQLSAMADGERDGPASVQVVNTGENHYYHDMDFEMVADKTAGKLQRKLRYGRGRR